MALTRIKTDQITDLAVTNPKLANFTIEGGKLANNLTYGSSLTISGNLTVNGTTTTLDTTNTVASDPLIVVNRNASGANALDMGLIFERGSSTNVAIIYDESADEFALVGTNETGTTAGNIAIIDYQGLRLGELNVDNINIVNNTISSTDANGNIYLDPAGTGQVEITGPGYVTGNLSVDGNVTLGNASGDGHLINGNVQITNGLNVSGGNNTMTGNLTVDGNVVLGNNAADGHTINGIVTGTGQFNYDNLRLDGNTLSSTNTNGDINLDPNGTGDVIVATGSELKITDLTTTRVVFVGTAGALTDNANFTFDSGTGNVVVNGLLNVDNLRLDANTLSSTNSNGNIDITANGTGKVNIDNIAIDGNTISSINANGNIALDPNGTGVTTVASDVYITGNLYVTGTETIFNVIASSTEDPVLHLGGAADASILTSNDGMDRGIEVHWYDTADRHGFFGLDNSTGEFTFIPYATEPSLNTYSGSEGTARFGNVKVVSLTSNRVVYVGASDELVDSSNLTFNGSTLALTGTGNVTGQLNVDNLRLDANTLSSTDTNGNINITANGTGTVNIDNVVIDGNTITTLDANGDLLLNPNGTGNVVVSAGGQLQVADLTPTRVVFVGANDNLTDSANFTFISGTGAATISGSLDVDNVKIDGSTISSTPSNGNLTITANGSGTVIVESVQITSNDITTSSSALVFNEAGADVNIRVEGDTEANLLFIDAGLNNIGIKTATPSSGAALHINSVDSMIIPVGASVDRPGTPVTGMFRFNSTTVGLEVWDGTQWAGTGSTFTIATSQTFTGDGSTTAFTISATSTSAASLVSINGVVQIPVTAYGITGTTLTFTEAPEAGDTIEVRKLVTTSTVVALSSSDGGATVEVERTSGDNIIRFLAGADDRVNIDGSVGTGLPATMNLLNGTKTAYNQTGVSVGTSAVTVDSFAKATYRSAKYIVQVSNGSEHETSEVLVVHDGTTANRTEYAVVNCGTSLGSTSVTISGANVLLQYTGVGAGNTVKVYPTYIAA